MVLDASALSALLLDEPGADKVRAVLDDSVVGTVDLAEPDIALAAGVEVEVIR